MSEPPPYYNTYQSYTPYQPVPPTQPLMTTQSVVWGEVNSFARYRPQRHHCQFCNNNIVTEVVYEAGNMTFLAAGAICLACGWLGCCLIPFAVDSLKDVVHMCPQCHNAVGKKTRL